MAQTERVEIHPCSDNGCTGCEDFYQKLLSTPAGKDALYLRYGMHPGKNPFNHQNITMCAQTSSSPTPIGIVESCLIPETTDAQLGVIVDPDHRHQGHAKALVQAMGQQLIPYGVTRIIAEIDTQNFASKGLALAMGAKFEKIDRYGRVISYPLK